MPEAGDHMIVNQTGSLHKGIACRESHKTETVMFQIFAHGI